MLYFASTFSRVMTASLWSLLAGLILYLLFDFLEHLRLILTYKAPYSELFVLALAHLPTAVYQLIPLALLIGSLAGSAAMARDRELIALLLSGQGLFRRSLPFLTCAAAAGLLMFVWGEWCTPFAERAYREHLDFSVLQLQRPEAAGVNGRWFKGPSGIWRVSGGSGRKLAGVSLYGFDRLGNLERRWDAESLIFEDGGWVAEGLKRLDSGNGAAKGQRLRLPALQEKPQHFQAYWRPPGELNLQGIFHVVELRREQGLDTLEYETESIMRLALPLLCLSMPLWALGMAWRRGRVGRSSGRLVTMGLGMMIGLVFFLAISAGRGAALAGICPPVPAILGIPAVSFVLGLFALGRTRL